jgi:hypothetical protein
VQKHCTLNKHTGHTTVHNRLASALNFRNERLFDFIPGTLNDTTQPNGLLLLQNNKTVLERMLKATVMVDFKRLNRYLEKELKPWKNTGLEGRSTCRHPQAETFKLSN